MIAARGPFYSAWTICHTWEDDMQVADDNSARTNDSELAVRREFLRTIRRSALTVPAVALLLAASTRPHSAQAQYGETIGRVGTRN